MSHRPRPEGPVGVAVLGSTGSIGQQTLQVIDAYPERFHVVALAARTSSSLFAAQIARYHPQVIAIGDLDPAGPALEPACVTGEEGLLAAALHPAVDIVVVATSGHVAIAPTIQAIRAEKTVALANKETLVCAGELVVPLVSRGLAQLRPVDSEHSAIWQASQGMDSKRIERIVLTASGGPFRTTPSDALKLVTSTDALAHPTWRMGNKVTVDSATLMNKGLEVIEAHWLFGVSYEQIDVVVHPQSIVHSLVELVDGSQLAQLGLPDMRLPIQFALTYPDRLPVSGKKLRLAEIGSLHFEPADEVRFPALRLAREAGMAGRTYPTVLSVADEVAVAAFLEGKIRFTEIPAVVSAALDKHQPVAVSLETISEVTKWARVAGHNAIAELA